MEGTPQNSQQIDYLQTRILSRSHAAGLWLSCLVFQWTLLSLLPGSFSEPDIASRENDNSEEFTDTSEVLGTAESLRTNSHGGPVNKSKTILELYHKVSDKESEDQEILLNLIEKSKDKNSVDSYVTIKPRPTKKPTKRPLTSKKSNFSPNKRKRKFKPSSHSDIDSLRRRRKRKKLIDRIKEKRKPSHMQVRL